MGLGAGEPEVSMEDILKASEAFEARTGNDAVKTLALGEDDLAKMPSAPQPPQLKATLLPYQLQVSLHLPFTRLRSPHPYLGFKANGVLGPCVDDSQRKPRSP